MLSLLLMAAAAQAPASAPTDPLVVIGQRLQRLRFHASVDKQGRARCRIRRSSGDPALDALACAAVYDCASIQAPRASQIEACIGGRISARYRILQEQE